MERGIDESGPLNKLEENKLAVDSSKGPGGWLCRTA